MRALLIVIAALAAAAPLHAQPDAPRRLPTCIREASAAAGTEMTRYSCAGSGAHRDVRLSVTLPADWTVAWQDTADLSISARLGDTRIWAVGSDQLPRPDTGEDSLAFWRRATEMLVRREVSEDEVEDFRGANSGRVASAREWITRSRLGDTALVNLAEGLFATRDGSEVLRREGSLRSLAGEPAGYFSEVVMVDGAERRHVFYATMRDGALFVVSLNVAESEYEALLPLFDRVLASFDPRTERW